MVTFVKATYVIATFVRISNISAVCNPILTKLGGPIFFAALFIVQQIFWTKIFGLNILLNKIFWTNLKSIKTQNLF